MAGESRKSSNPAISPKQSSYSRDSEGNLLAALFEGHDVEPRREVSSLCILWLLALQFAGPQLLFACTASLCEPRNLLRKLKSKLTSKHAACMQDQKAQVQAGKSEARKLTLWHCASYSSTAGPPTTPLQERIAKAKASKLAPDKSSVHASKPARPVEVCLRCKTLSH